MRLTIKHLFDRHQKTGVQFIKFAMIGVLNTLISYLVFLLLYRLAGLHYLASSAIGYCVGVINSFLLNKKWTFKTINVARGYEFFKFVVVNIVALTVNMIVLEIAVAVLHIIPEIGQVAAIFFSTCTNFIGNKLWTFNSIHEKHPRR